MSNLDKNTEEQNLFSEDSLSNQDLQNSTDEVSQTQESSTPSTQATVSQESSEDRVMVNILENTIKESYLNYAMSVIASRALPDVRDGLKPVHRRILFTMYKMGLTPSSKYVKSARVIGEVLGKYHPHGDVAVYMALVRLAQDFSMRYPLIDGQGNFGSIDGDTPAAMRYTESRMASPSPWIVKDLEKQTVDFLDNYDGSQKEPKVMPTIFPNLIVNGQTGIAVGMATEVPPHNLHEVVEAVTYLIRGYSKTQPEIQAVTEGFVKVYPPTPLKGGGETPVVAANLDSPLSEENPQNSSNSNPLEVVQDLNSETLLSKDVDQNVVASDHETDHPSQQGTVISFGTPDTPKAREEVTIEELMHFIKGPDFPTAALIYGQKDILEAYKTGRGRCLVKSKVELTEKAIIVREIPYQVNKANLLMKISDLIKNKKIEGIRDIRDESNKEGIRIVVEVKRDSSPEIILNQLYQLTELQTYQHFNLLALVNDGRQPKLLNLKEILVHFIDHRFDVVTRRTQFELNQAEAELHILEGLKIALDNIDRVIQLIRSSYDKEEAGQKLRSEFDLSKKQSDAILQMRLQTLTNLDKTKIEKQREEKIALIKKLKEILENPDVMRELVAGEIEEMADKFKLERRTQVFKNREDDYDKEDVIEEEEVVVQLTKAQYIKVTSVDNFRTQARGGRGVTSYNPKENDWVKTSILCSNHDYLYAFSSNGRVFRLRVFDLPTGSRKGRGQALINYFPLEKDEIITSILTVDKQNHNFEEASLIFATQKGTVKKTKIELFERINKNGKIAIGLNEGDHVLDVKVSTSQDEKVILSASNGKTVIFEVNQLSALGRTAKGVRGMKLKDGDNLVSMELEKVEVAENPEEIEALIESEEGTKRKKEYPSLLVVTSKGYGKQTSVKEYRLTKRGASGVKNLNLTSKTGKPVIVELLNGDEENLIVTTKNGVTIRIEPSKISQLSRNTQGVKLIKLGKGDEVISGGVS